MVDVSYCASQVVLICKRNYLSLPGVFSFHLHVFTVKLVAFPNLETSHENLF